MVPFWLQAEKSICKWIGQGRARESGGRRFEAEEAAQLSSHFSIRDQVQKHKINDLVQKGQQQLRNSLYPFS